MSPIRLPSPGEIYLRPAPFSIVPYFPPMSLTSRIESPCTTPAPKPFTFPGIFRNKKYGNLWLASGPRNAIRIARGPGAPMDHDVGDQFAEVNLSFRLDNPAEYEQVTTPVTITFNPQS